jgi:hypothetical protein
MAIQTSIQSELFKNLIEIDVNEYCIDLHNDYDCIQLNFSGINNELLFSFKSLSADAKYPLVILQFEAVELKKINIDLQIDAQCRTIDNLYRCRFLQDGVLIEYSNEGKAFYSLEFCEGHSLEFFSNKLMLILE